MRYLGFIVCFLFVSLVTAQDRRDLVGKIEGTITDIPKELYRARELVIDTIYHPAHGDECALHKVHVGLQGTWGRISGMNGLGDLEKGQTFTFDAKEKFQVVGVIVYFVEPRVVGNGIVNCKIYDTDPQTGAPTRLRGFSDGVRMDDIVRPDSVQPLPTIFTFESGVDVFPDNPEFIASVDFSTLYATQDTLVIWQTDFECGDGADTWELHNDGTSWVNMISPLSWESNFDLYMGVIIEFDQAVSSKELVGFDDLKISKVWPNPTSDQVTLSYTVRETSDVTVSCHDAAGKEVFRKKRRLINGLHREVIETGNWPEGQYMISVRTDRAQLAQLLHKL